MIKVIRIEGRKYNIIEIKNQDNFKEKCIRCDKIPYKYYIKLKYGIACLSCIYKNLFEYPSKKNAYINQNNKDLKRFIKDYEKYLVLERL